MQYQNRSTLLNYFKHLVQNSKLDDHIQYELDLITLFCKCRQQSHIFIKDPSTYLKQLETYLLQNIPSQKFEDKVRYYNSAIIFKNIPYLKSIYQRFSELTAKHVGKWVVIVGTVIQITQKKALEKDKVYSCNQCQAEYRVSNTYQNYYKFQMPTACTNIVQKEKTNNLFSKFYKNLSKRKPEGAQKQTPQTKMSKCGCTKFTALQQKKICLDYQQLRIQEPFKHISAGKLPQTLTVIIQGNSMVDSFRPGDDIAVSGLLDYRYKKLVNDLKVQCQMIVVANNILIHKSSFKDNFDKESLNENTQYLDYPLPLLESMVQNKQLNLIKQLEHRNQVIKKYCPQIFGREVVKLGLILSILGGVSLNNEHTRIRGQSHILLIGQPGTGKSVLIKEAAKLSERSFFTNGIGTTSAGLSVSYYKDGSDWCIEAGALVLADNGVCCIDELTLMAKKQQHALLQAMQQQTISSAKASIVGKLNARTTVIAACNPITPNQRHDPSLDLEVNTGLSIPLLTRFDLVLMLKDESDRHEDSLKCDHILGKFGNQGGGEWQKKGSQFCLKSLLKKCKTYQPQLQNGELLSNFYTQQRKNIDKVTTARAFESLVRLTQAHAKLMMRQQTNQLDCITAIMLTEGNFATTIEQYYEFLGILNQKYGVQVGLY